MTIKQNTTRFLRLFIGILLSALGIVLTIRANIGYAPWEVFHAGVSRITGLSFGIASNTVGITIGTAAVLMGETIGAGTVLNMFLTGLIIDLIIASGVIPLATGMAEGVAMLVAGMFVMAVATYFYMGAGLGSGPRDCLMVALTRRTRLPVGVCRSAIEISALLAGWLMGGAAGAGTVISVFAIGFCIQLTFKLFRFKPEEVEHETLTETYIGIKELIISHTRPPAE